MCISMEALINCMFSTRAVFKPISRLMGGKVRVVLAGGAPLSPDTHEQIQICLCVSVYQGYGLTETTSAATVMDSECSRMLGENTLLMVCCVCCF